MHAAHAIRLEQAVILLIRVKMRHGFSQWTKSLLTD